VAGAPARATPAFEAMEIDRALSWRFVRMIVAEAALLARTGASVIAGAGTASATPRRTLREKS